MQSNAQIIYTVIARDQQVVLSEYSFATGNFIQVAKQIIQDVSGQSVKKSLPYDEFYFHVLVESNYTYLIMAEKGFPVSVAFEALEDIKNTFISQYTQQVRDGALAYGLNASFSKVQKEKMTYYIDQLRQIKTNEEVAKRMMMEELDKTLERGEKINLLVQQIDAMVNISTHMKTNASTIRRQKWWRNKKMMLILVLLVLLAIYMILGFACGFTFSKC